MQYLFTAFSELTAVFHENSLKNRRMQWCTWCILRILW